MRKKYKVHYRHNPEPSGIKKIYNRINSRYFDSDVSLGVVIGMVAFLGAVYLLFCAGALIWQSVAYG